MDTRYGPSTPIPEVAEYPAIDPANYEQKIDWDELLGFTDKQKTALAAIYKYRFILYGGARGGGKSFFLRWAAVDFLVTLFFEKGLRNVRVGLFCETYPDLRDRQISKIKLEFPAWLGRLVETKEQGLAFILHESFGGGVIALRNLDDPTKYQSAEFAAIFVDELTKTTKDTFDILRGSLRWPGVDHTIFVGATNPGSIGHAWVKALWIDKVFPKEMEPLRPQFCFIQSLPSDNPKLSQTYWDDLNTLPEDLRKAWVLGMWDVFEGQAFSSWGPQHIVDDFDIPDHWPRTVGIDWGYRDPFAVTYGAINPMNKQVVIYDEIYQSGLTDEEQARLIRMHSEGQFIRFYFADPSMWKAQTGTVTNITSTADIYLKNGIYLQRADNDRLSGKRKLDRLLLNTPYGEPGIVFQRKCKNTIRTLPSLPYAEGRKGEDVDTKAEDHLYDSIRYLLTASKGVPLDIRGAPVVHEQTTHPLFEAFRRRRTLWR